MAAPDPDKKENKFTGTRVRASAGKSLRKGGGDKKGASAKTSSKGDKDMAKKASGGKGSGTTHRSAVSGRFTTAKKAAKSPSTHVTHKKKK
jgi:hypothetical protein